MKIGRLIFLFLCFLILFSFTSEQKRKAPYHYTSSDTFPVPPVNDKFLFYVQRTPNTNTIVYELNLNNDGSINEEDPVHIFWIRYKENGSKEELSYMQRKYAYGLHCKLMDSQKLNYKINFVSYGKRYLYLQRSAVDKKYHMYMYIAGKWAMLYRVFLNIQGGTFWLPNITNVEIYGKEYPSGKAVVEVFEP